MAALETRYFGTLQYSEDAVFVFPAGLPGFEMERRFLFVEQPVNKPLVFMQSVERPELCFVALPVTGICPDYRLALSAEDRQALELAADAEPVPDRDVILLALISLADQQPPTANLLSPVVVNVAARKALQAIQADSGYSHRHPLVSEVLEAVCS
jgi:flagellar assembly factor FliW